MIVIIPKFNFILDNINYNINQKYIMSDTLEKYRTVKDINNMCYAFMSSDYIKTHFYNQEQIRQLKINSL